jgi:hypothetical protein
LIWIKAPSCADVGSGSFPADPASLARPFMLASVRKRTSPYPALALTEPGDGVALRAINGSQAARGEAQWPARARRKQALRKKA